MGYLRPVDAPITDDWQEHIDRGSGEPGVDYACAYGTPVIAVGNGTITSVKHDNSGGPGRYVQYLLDDGKETRSLHFSEVWAYVGQHVTAGQHVGLSGGSGYGSDHYYGSHVHHTLWPGRAWQAHTIDFELYVGGTLPQVLLEDDMPQFFEPNTIVWPNGWANSYDAQVYAAMKSYAQDPYNPSTQWVRDTWVRESWAAVEGIQNRQVQVAQEAAVAGVSARVGVGALVIALAVFVLRR